MRTCRQTGRAKCEHGFDPLPMPHACAMCVGIDSVRDQLARAAKVKGRKPRPVGPCPHRGKATGKTTPCETCGGKQVKLKLYPCTFRKVDVTLADCRTCPVLLELG